MTAGNVFEFALFVVLGLFIAWGWIRLLLHRPAKPNPHNRRRGGGGESADSPDYSPYTGESIHPPAPERSKRDEPGPVYAPAVSRVAKHATIEQDRFVKGEWEWVQLGRELNPPAPVEIPDERPIEVTPEFERIRKEL